VIRYWFVQPHCRVAHIPMARLCHIAHAGLVVVPLLVPLLAAASGKGSCDAAAAYSVGPNLAMLQKQTRGGSSIEVTTDEVQVQDRPEKTISARKIHANRHDQASLEGVGKASEEKQSQKRLSVTKAGYSRGHHAFADDGGASEQGVVGKKTASKMHSGSHHDVFSDSGEVLEEDAQRRTRSTGEKISFHETAMFTRPGAEPKTSAESVEEDAHSKRRWAKNAADGKSLKEPTENEAGHVDRAQAERQKSPSRRSDEDAAFADDGGASEKRAARKDGWADEEESGHVKLLKTTAKRKESAGQGGRTYEEREAGELEPARTTERQRAASPRSDEDASAELSDASADDGGVSEEKSARKGRSAKKQSYSNKADTVPDEGNVGKEEKLGNTRSPKRSSFEQEATFADPGSTDEAPTKGKAATRDLAFEDDSILHNTKSESGHTTSQTKPRARSGSKKEPLEAFAKETGQGKSATKALTKRKTSTKAQSETTLAKHASSEDRKTNKGSALVGSDIATPPRQRNGMAAGAKKSSKSKAAVTAAAVTSVKPVTDKMGDYKKGVKAMGHDTMTNGENDDAYEVDGAKTQTLDNVEGVNEVEAAAKEMSVKKARSSAADDSDYESDSDEFDNGGEATESESASVGDAKQLFDQKGHNKKGGKTNRHDTSTNSDNEDANKGDDMKTEPLADDEGAAQEETAGNEKWVERASYPTEDHSNTDSDSDKLADGGATEYESAAEDSITKKASAQEEGDGKNDYDTNADRTKVDADIDDDSNVGNSADLDAATEMEVAGKDKSAKPASSSSEDARGEGRNVDAFAGDGEVPEHKATADDATIDQDPFLPEEPAPQKGDGETGGLFSSFSLFR